MSSKQYDVTVPFTVWVTVRVTIDEDRSNIEDPEYDAIEAAYVAVKKGAVYRDVQEGLSTQKPARDLRHDYEFHNPWDHIDIDVVEVTDGVDGEGS